MSELATTSEMLVAVSSSLLSELVRARLLSLSTGEGEGAVARFCSPEGDDIVVKLWTPNRYWQRGGPVGVGISIVVEEQKSIGLDY